MGFKTAEMGMAEFTRGTGRCSSPAVCPGYSKAGGISCSKPGLSGWLHTDGHSLLRGKRKPRVTKKLHIMDREWTFLMSITKI